MTTVVCVNLFMLGLTLCKYYVPYMPQNWRLFPAFNLALEMNLAVWWASLLLMTAGTLALEVRASEEKENRILWLILSGILYLLSFDELASFHERIEPGHLVLVGLVIVGLIAWSVVGLLKKRAVLPAEYLIAGFVLFALVIVQEILEWVLPWPQAIEGLRLAAEEGSELFGSTLIIAGIYARKRRLKADLNRWEIIPDLRIKNSGILAMTVLTTASILFIHLLWPRLEDLHTRGNPAVWFPMLANFLLFTVFWRRGIGKSMPRAVTLRFTAIGFLLCSAGSVYNLSDFFFRINRVVPVPLLASFFFYLLWHLGVQLALSVTALGLRLRTRAMLMGMTAAGFFFGSLSGFEVAAWTYIEVYTLFSFILITMLIQRTPSRQ